MQTKAPSTLTETAYAVQEHSLAKVLMAPKAARFVAEITKENYQEHYRGHEDEVGRMVDLAWRLLVGQAGGSKSDLQSVTAEISQDIFRKNDPDFWFNQDYHRYKSEIRPPEDFNTVRKFISGKRILDFGGGSGYFALNLAENGYRAHITDVLDYRIKDAKELPFVLMSSADEIPYPADSFDTVIIKTVLHHVDADGLSTILNELHRVSRRVIIEEDVFGLSRNTDDVFLLLQAQRQLGEYLELSLDDQIRSLMLIDYFGNVITQGVPEMNLPFQFKTMERWVSILEEHDFNVVETKPLGFQAYRINRPCQALLVADRKGSYA